MKPFREALFRLVYPSACGVCDRLLEIREEAVCGICFQQLQAKRFTWHEAAIDHDLSFVGESWALYPYESPAKELIMSIKFSRKRWLMHAFEEDLSRFVCAFAGEGQYDYLIPVPLDPMRLLGREFNQSELIAHHISRSSRIPVASMILLKSRWSSSPQSQLSREERRTHLLNAFKVRQSEKIAGKNLLLVDDIFTTGFTAEEAARMLKRHGAKRVDFFALARSEIRAAADPARSRVPSSGEAQP